MHMCMQACIQTTGCVYVSYVYTWVIYITGMIAIIDRRSDRDRKRARKEDRDRDRRFLDFLEMCSYPQFQFRISNIYIYILIF